MSLFFPIISVPAEETENNLTAKQELAKTETFLHQNYLDQLHVKNEEALAELQEKNAKLAVRQKTERDRKLVIQRMRKKLPYLELPYIPLDHWNYKVEAEKDPLAKLPEKEFNQLLKEGENRYKKLAILSILLALLSLGGTAVGIWAMVWQFSLHSEASLGIMLGSIFGIIGVIVSFFWSISGALPNMLKILKSGPKIS